MKARGFDMTIWWVHFKEGKYNSLRLRMEAETKARAIKSAVKKANIRGSGWTLAGCRVCRQAAQEIA